MYCQLELIVCKKVRFRVGTKFLQFESNLFTKAFHYKLRTLQFSVGKYFEKLWFKVKAANICNCKIVSQPSQPQGIVPQLVLKSCPYSFDKQTDSFNKNIKCVHIRP